jgi:polyribonucleotide nucleotidyltransferase
MPEVGERYLGTVVKTTTFGAFVSLMPGKDGLLHISKMRSWPAASASRTSRTSSQVGQKVQVEISEIDDRGKLSLSRSSRGPTRPRDAAERGRAS